MSEKRSHRVQEVDSTNIDKADRLKITSECQLRTKKAYVSHLL